jgi:hypothetical protein
VSDATEPLEAQLQIRWDPEAALPAPTYANYLQVTYTPEDFTMQLGWYAVPAMNRPPEDGLIDVLVQPIHRVSLPLNLMRNVVALLERQIQAYEDSFGSISEHPNKPPWLRQQEEAGGEAVDDA